MDRQVHDTHLNIKAAAKLLGVSTKTVQRHLARGLLSKHKEGGRTLLLRSEVETLACHPIHGKGRNVSVSAIDSGGQPKDMISVDRDHYEGLLMELGQLRSREDALAEESSEFLENLDVIKRLEAQVEYLTAKLRELDSRIAELAGLRGGHGGISQVDPKAPKPWWQV